MKRDRSRLPHNGTHFTSTYTDPQEYPFYTLSSLPEGVLRHIGGLVSARSVKLLDKIHNPGICTCYCIPRKYNVPLIITNLTSALNSLKFLVVNVLHYAHAHVKHVKNRYHKGTLKWQD